MSTPTAPAAAAAAPARKKRASTISAEQSSKIQKHQQESDAVPEGEQLDDKTPVLTQQVTTMLVKLLFFFY